MLVKIKKKLDNWELCTAWTVVLAEVAVPEEETSTTRRRHCHHPPSTPEGVRGLCELQDELVGELEEDEYRQLEKPEK